jgi:hypothetical protein
MSGQVYHLSEVLVFVTASQYFEIYKYMHYTQ